MDFDESSFFKELIRDLDLFLIETRPDGKIMKISARFAERLLRTPETLDGLHMRDLLPEEFYNELYGARADETWQNLNNYRTLMRDAEGRAFLVQISGYRFLDNGDGRYRMLIQELKQASVSDDMIDVGNFKDNIKAHEIVRKYIPSQLRAKARFAVKSGMDCIPDEVRNLTFLFADLVSFTTFAESRMPDEVINTLNRSIGAASAAIMHWGGTVDKFMGDCIMAVFESPLNAVIAAVEIQKQFKLFNLIRKKNDLEELHLRIGINTGKCIQGSIGTDNYMEWTVIGSAVNSASRLEKASRADSILVSSETIKHVRDRIQVLDAVELSMRGIHGKIMAYYVNRVNFSGPDGEPISLGLDDEIDLEGFDARPLSVNAPG